MLVLRKRQLTVTLVVCYMKKKQLVLVVICVCVCFAGCSKNPQSVRINEYGIAQEERKEIVAEKDGDDVLISVPDQFVYEYNVGNESKHIDIPVSVPKQKPMKSVLKKKQMLIEEICSQLEPEGNWQKNDELAQYIGSEEAYETFVIMKDGTSIVRQLAWFEDKNYIYSNTDGDETMFPVDAELICENNWSDEQKKYAEEKCLYAETVFKNMGMDFRVTDIQLYEYQGIRYATCFLALVVNDLTVCDLDGITSQMDNIIINAEITLSDERISEFRIIGNYEIVSQEVINLLSWEQIERIFEEELENADWGMYDLKKVKMEYIAKSDMTLIPVWSFYGEVATDINKPLLCLNACTGKVEFQWGM